jgi:hypothetical protein
MDHEMNFRIRHPDADEAEFERCENAYRQHLKRFKKTSNTDLWKFFGWDFFHDGTVKSVRVEGDLRTVVLELDCPNIKRFKSDGNYEYTSVGFACTFQNVTVLNIHDETPEHAWEMKKYYTIFLDAEINTCPTLDRFAPEDELEPDLHYSLLIRLLADDSIIWLELVFSQVDVVADEPAAFALMESDPRFHVPTWLGDKED